MTLLEVLIASSLFVIFVAAAMSAGTSANKQDLLNSNSMALLEDTGRLQSFLTDEFAHVAMFEAPVYTPVANTNANTCKGGGGFPYPNISGSTPLPTAPLVANDSTVYTFSYIKLRTHLVIVNNPINQPPFSVSIQNSSTSPNPRYVGVDNQPVGMSAYVNSNPTFFMIYDPNQNSADGWWVRPQWETFSGHEGDDLAANSDPVNLRIYSLQLRPSNRIWTVLQPNQSIPPSPPFVELGDIVRTYRNGENGVDVDFPVPLATGIDRRSFSIKLAASVLTMRFRQYRIVTTNPWQTISRPFELSVRLTSIPP